MHWSFYNQLFKSSKYGWLLYNTLTGAFLSMPEQAAQAVSKAPEQAAELLKTYPLLFLQLRTMRALVYPGEDERLLNILRRQHQMNRMRRNSLDLAIAPTSDCNFRCDYCYEHPHQAEYMSDQTAADLMDFIIAHQPFNSLQITWYGGEPLLEFERIRSLSKCLEQNAVNYTADLVTNGYLLTRSVARELSALNIVTMQVTIDGVQKVHDQRRVLRDQSPTYEQIMTNLEYLLQVWSGKLTIRVNLDQRNHATYMQAYNEIRTRLPSKQVYIYPGIVETIYKAPCGDCRIPRQQEIDFYIELQEKYGLDPRRFFLPEVKTGCMAEYINAHLVGPDGSLYRCWRDLGKKEMSVGKVGKKMSLDLDLVAQYMIGTDPIEDPKCRKCKLLPYCMSGSCRNKRWLKKYKNEAIDVCPHFKTDLPALLEVQYQKSLQARANAISDQEPWRPVNTRYLTNNYPGQRSAKNYARVIEQFEVENRARYQARDKNTFCNIFVWDVTRAMHAEIPHWVDESDRPCPMGCGRELQSNATLNWLEKHGHNYGWQEYRGKDMVDLKNHVARGCPAVAIYRNSSGQPGHIAIVHPLQRDEQDLYIAHAGAENSEYIQLDKGFGNNISLADIRFFIHE